ncbi:hypothetical protein DRE_01122 [Drechslerella stenobrocha 248]|uniref:Uncharacterized protein n=1 Tax=Drechslerella stenobrocha 248 TaxID=1043628 RepID=W7HJY6_9PEZI|nr:hypothetical protein DRE_01122 [Drechslerella stenobrocha 248]
MASAVPTPSLRSLVFATYRTALKAGAVHFTETDAHNLSHNDINYQIRYAPNLLKKPSPKREQSAAAAVAAPKFNPFLPPDPALYLTPILQTHYAVLNKFPVHAGHFVLATADFQPQPHPLTTADFAAVLAVLRSWHADADPASAPAGGDDDPTTRESREHPCLYGFFNSGVNSGASQPHRHIQFLPLTAHHHSSLWATRMFAAPATVATTTDEGVGFGSVGGVEVRYQTRISYKHYFSRIPAECTPEYLHRIYHTLLALASHTLAHPTLSAAAVIEEVDAGAAAAGGVVVDRWPADEAVEFSYNMAFSKEWVGILPRTNDTVYVLGREEESGVVLDGVAVKCPGLNLNGTILAGMMLLRTRREMDAVINDVGCIDRAVAEIGVPQSGAQKPSSSL